MRLGFSRDELHTFVEEADKAQTYVCGHLYSDEAVRRAVDELAAEDFGPARDSS